MNVVKSNASKMQNLFECIRKRKITLKLEVKQQEYRQELSKKKLPMNNLAAIIEESREPWETSKLERRVWLRKTT